MLLIALSACAPGSDFELYEGRNLHIAVIGEPPEVEEERVSFEKISFDELAIENLSSFDAVIIRENNLQEAAESQYADVYLDPAVPFFFMGTILHLPFTQKDMDYHNSYNWRPGSNYTVGVYRAKADQSVHYWGTSFYNDEKTDAHMQDLYSRIFIKIEGETS